MWCKNCRQDVPAVAAGNGSVRCSRCGGGLHKREPVAVTVHTAGLEEESVESEFDLPAGQPSPPESNIDFDDWLLDVELQRLQRLISAGAGGPQSTASPTFTTSPFPFSATPNVASFSNAPRMGQVAVPPEKVAPRKASLLVWSLLGSGIMAFVCGAVLLAWSLITGRGELWTLGMPICLGGQLGLLLGLMFQLTRLWDDNRQTASQLNSVDDRLSDLRRTSALLATGNGTAGQSFYAHMAGGASPQMLVADLKGQLDLLAMQMAAARH